MPAGTGVSAHTLAALFKLASTTVLKIFLRTSLCSHFFFFFGVLGMEAKALHMLGKHSTTEQQPPRLFSRPWVVSTGSCLELLKG